uniref:Reverse transcriptase zinc-binding domain-containing protein n=1 Tax=Pygocentrus nattereri TaxID=42514 RepID=A0AAR2LML4_PYGNA
MFATQHTQCYTGHTTCKQDFINYFKREWAIYLEQNNLPEISPCVLWEAGKAVMRGKIISYCAHKKNKEKTLILELEQKIKSLENAYAASPQENIINNYSINWSKSTVLPLNCKFQNIIPTSLQSGNIRYLGINFSPRLLDLVRLNHIPLLKTIEDDLTRWNSLPISLMGRVATIKMMILPKVNYLFLMIPNKPSIAWFKSLDSNISKFLWKSKTSRISLKTLQKLKCSGGLELPNFYHYFLANRLQYVSRWMKSNRSDSPWLDLEQTLCGKLKISDLPLISSSIKHYNCFKSLTISNYIENYMHAIWSCMPVQRFWQTICEDLSTWFHCDIQVSPKLCILGDISELNIETNISHIVLTALCIAKKTILMKWKSKNDLCITHYRNLLLDHISLGRMSATTKNQLTTFESLWSPLISSIT